MTHQNTAANLAFDWARMKNSHWPLILVLTKHLCNAGCQVQYSSGDQQGAVDCTALVGTGLSNHFCKATKIHFGLLGEACYSHSELTD